jgi:hypothetical protein
MHMLLDVPHSSVAAVWYQAQALRWGQHTQLVSGMYSTRGEGVSSTMVLRSGPNPFYPGPYLQLKPTVKHAW